MNGYPYQLYMFLSAPSPVTVDPHQIPSILSCIGKYCGPGETIKVSSAGKPPRGAACREVM